MNKILSFFNIKLNILILVPLMLNAYDVFSNNVVLITHGYGDTNWSEDRYFNMPVVYPLNESKKIS